jgi:hypothetical protein
VVIGDASQPWVDLDDTTGVTLVGDGDPFALRLKEGAVVLDAVQVGGAGDHGEGEPVADDGAECFSRFAGVDTGDNLFDFVPGWTGTPGS